MLNEIKLDKQRPNNLLNIRDYLSIHKFRNYRGSGVAILIKYNMELSELVKLDVLSSEIIGIKVPVKIGSLRKNIKLISIYQPPNQKTL